MPQQRNYQTEAIVIKKSKLGEADRILTLLSPDEGKIRAVAKGIRRPKSKMAGHLELLTHSLVTLAHGRNLDTITGSQTINSFFQLKSDLRLASCALYLAELTDQLTAERMENRTLFHLLLGTFNRLCQPGNADFAVRCFEMRLLSEVGYQPELYHCVGCRKNLEPVTNAFSFSLGGVLCPSCLASQPYVYTLNVNVLKVLRLMQRNDENMLGRLKISPEFARELEEILRRYIRFLLEKEVRSTGWMDTVKSLDIEDK